MSSLVADDVADDVSDDVAASRSQGHPDLESRIAELAGVWHATAGALVTVIGDAMDSGQWEGVGVHSPGQWLSWKAGVSLNTAHRIAGVARRRHEIPAAVEALVAGELSLDAAVLISRHVPIGYDQAAVELSKSMLMSQFGRLLPRYGWDEEHPQESGANPGQDEGQASDHDAEAGDGRPGDGPDPNLSDEGPLDDTGPDDTGADDTGVDDTGAGADSTGENTQSSNPDQAEDGDGSGHGNTGSADDPSAHGSDSRAASKSGTGPGGAGRRRPEPAPELAAKVSCWWDDDQCLHISAVLPTDQGLAFEAALEASRQDLWKLRAKDSSDVTDRQDGSYYQGINKPGNRIGNRSALMNLIESFMANGTQQHPHADRYRIHAHLGIDPLNRNQIQANLGPVLPTYLRRYLSCDTTITPVWEHLGNPLAVGRSQRIVPDKLRHLIEHRDGGCVIPGCGATKGLQVHHVVHWEDGGTTEPANLITLCRKHHRNHHSGQLGIAGNPETGGPGGLRITDRFGRVLQDNPGIVSPKHPDPQRAAEQAHIRTANFNPATGETCQLGWIQIDRNPHPN